VILIDFSQISYSCILEHLASTKQTHASVEMCRHMILNTIRSNVKKFRRDYGEVVVAYDDKNYWRREYFSHYKANRKAARAKSAFNWDSIFQCMNTLKDELKTHLMYKVIHVENAEADDIIGTLTFLHAPASKIMIVSGDKDFIQLQTHKNVSQWSPLIKKAVVDEFPALTLKQHIIRGDSGDGVPNILSPDDVFVTGGRQKPILEKKLIDWLNKKPEDFCTGDMLRNYKRNEKLIDLRQIPIEISGKIGTMYECATHPTRAEFMNYLGASGLKELAKIVDDF
jgi:hypothetical protein